MRKKILVFGIIIYFLLIPNVKGEEGVYNLDAESILEIWISVFWIFIFVVIIFAFFLIRSILKDEKKVKHKKIETKRKIKEDMKKAERKRKEYLKIYETKRIKRIENEKIAEIKRIENEKIAEIKRIEDEKIAEIKRVEDERKRIEWEKKDTCPKCGDRGFFQLRKLYNPQTDVVDYYQHCLGCNYKKYQNKPTVNDFIEQLDEQFDNWNKKGK